MDLTKIDKATLKSLVKEILIEDKSILMEVIKEMSIENNLADDKSKKIHLKKFADKILSEDKELFKRLS